MHGSNLNASKHTLRQSLSPAYGPLAVRFTAQADCLRCLAGETLSHSRSLASVRIPKILVFLERAQCPALERERALGEVLWEDKMFLVITVWFIAAVALAVLFGFAVETGRGE